MFNLTQPISSYLQPYFKCPQPSLDSVTVPNSCCEATIKRLMQSQI